MGLTLDLRAVECKAKGSYSSVRSALDQAQCYQRHILWCYVATEASRLAFDFMVAERLGYLPVKNHSVEVESHSEVYKTLWNTRLDTVSYVITRQKLVAFDSFRQVFGTSIPEIQAFLVAHHFESDYGTEQESALKLYPLI
jgi:hypothetical protein